MVDRPNQRQLLLGSGASPRYRLNAQLARDLVAFSQIQYDSLDYDPFHPMVYHLGKQHKLRTEQWLWLSTLYMAFYNIGSAWAAFWARPSLGPLPDWAARLPVGVQRRSLRGGLVLKHIDSFVHHVNQHGGSIEAFLTQGFTDDRGRNWLRLKETVQSVWGNGRWSTFTTAELYQKVNRLPVLPVEIGNDGSTGPRHGLCRMFDLPNPTEYSVHTLDGLANHVFDHVKRKVTTRIFYLPRDHYDHGMLESQLCDFNSMCRGRYYIGRDIDRDQERVRKAEQALTPQQRTEVKGLADVWDARAAVFDRRYLGEYNGWEGRTAYAKTFYQQTGVIADHLEIRRQLGMLI